MRRSYRPEDTQKRPSEASFLVLRGCRTKRSRMKISNCWRREGRFGFSTVNLRSALLTGPRIYGLSLRGEKVPSRPISRVVPVLTYRRRRQPFTPGRSIAIAHEAADRKRIGVSMKRLIDLALTAMAVVCLMAGG